jgi:hypothetical protein
VPGLVEGFFLVVGDVVEEVAFVLGDMFGVFWRLVVLFVIFGSI